MNTKWTVAFTMLAIITLISLVYALVQTVKAQAAETEALAQREGAENFRKEKEAAVIEAQLLQQLHAECQQKLAACK